MMIRCAQGMIIIGMVVLYIYMLNSRRKQAAKNYGFSGNEVSNKENKRPRSPKPKRD